MCSKVRLTLMYVALFTIRLVRTPTLRPRSSRCSSSLRIRRRLRSCFYTCRYSRRRRSSQRAALIGRLRWSWPRCSSRGCSNTTSKCRSTSSDLELRRVGRVLSFEVCFDPIRCLLSLYRSQQTASYMITMPRSRFASRGARNGYKVLDLFQAS